MSNDDDDDDDAMFAHPPHTRSTQRGERGDGYEQ